jgi:hypothetical protein
MGIGRLPVLLIRDFLVLEEPTHCFSELLFPDGRLLGLVFLLE